MRSNIAIEADGVVSQARAIATEIPIIRPYPCALPRLWSTLACNVFRSSSSKWGNSDTSFAFVSQSLNPQFSA